MNSMNMARIAADLVRLGYAPIPIGPDKIPLLKWGAFHLIAPTRDELISWMPMWRRAVGVGVVTGRPHGLVVVDADDDDSWTWALATLPVVRGVKTRRGGHLHFRHPEIGIIGNKSGPQAVNPAPMIKLDVKGLGGLATAPHSRHPSGITYEPIGDWKMEVKKLPVLPEIIRYYAEERLPPPPPPPRPRGGHGDPGRALECYLRKRGGIPEQGAGSDEAVFRAAAWCGHNAPDLHEQDFVDAIRRERPEFDERWVMSKWRSARGGSRCRC
jgi:hypothetical protein